jgi:hypothetical protein
MFSLTSFNLIIALNLVSSKAGEVQDKFIYYYNFKRTNQSYRLKGKIPYQKFLDVKMVSENMLYLNPNR